MKLKRERKKKKGRKEGREVERGQIFFFYCTEGEISYCEEVSRSGGGSL